MQPNSFNNHNPSAIIPVENSVIKAIVVDDEPLAIEGLRLRLHHISDVKIVAECRNLREAEIAILKHRPDVVFLDIEMPGSKGMELFEILPEQSCPAIVFVTAYSRYAIDAFNLQALDYLVKPVNMERLQDAIKRLRERMSHQQLHVEKQRLVTALQSIAGVDPLTLNQLIQDSDFNFSAKLTIKDCGRTSYIPNHTIEWIDAAGDYMCVHAAGATHIIRSTMKELETQLNPQVFCRIHRSTLVNTKNIVRTESLPGGDMQLTLASGAQLKVSRSFKKQLKKILQ